MSKHERVLGPFLVTVNRSLSMIEMIKAGEYDNHEQAVREITEDRFGIDRTGELIYTKELFLVAPSRFGILVAPWQAEMRQEHWVQEKAPELLAQGALLPDLQREYGILAFGSSWRAPDGNLVSPGLWSDGGGRGAGTFWYGPGIQWGLRGRALVSRERR